MLKVLSDCVNRKGGTMKNLDRSCIAMAVALAFASPMVMGLSLGAPSLRSYLGQPLRVSIPYQLSEEERAEAICQHVVKHDDGLPSPGTLRLRAEASPDGGVLLHDKSVPPST